VTELNNLQKTSLVLSFINKLRERGSWCGETHIQKAMYFLQNLAGIPMGFKFILYKHGPFSFDFRDELTSMHVYGLLEHEARPFPYGPSLKTTELGKKIQDNPNAVITQYNAQTDFIAETLWDKSVVDLERMGTALYVTLLEKPPIQADQNTRAQKITELKPHVSLDDALAAVQKVDEMRLAFGD
jgi:hypothetical protein